MIRLDVMTRLGYGLELLWGVRGIGDGEGDDGLK